MQSGIHKEISKHFTYAQYQKLILEQGNKCAICGQEETTKRNGQFKNLAIDHCHKTNRVRGLLCERCNRRLGHYESSFDDAQHESFIRYLGGRPDGLPTEIDGKTFQQESPTHPRKPQI